MPRFLAIFASILLCFAPISGFSLGLGEIDLKSALNQPFDAEIPISSESANDLTALDVDLASAATFAQFGLDRAQFLSDFSFEVVDRAGSAIVLVKSSKPVVEPFVTLLLEISWAQGRLLREYTVLLDPPAFAAESVAPAIAAPAAGPASAPGPTRVVQNESTAQPAAPAPAAPASPARTQSSRPGPVVASPPPAREADSSYGPVRRNDTLWSIAGQYASESVNRNQVMLAIYRANPEAFAGNINRLKAGMILRIPDAAELAGLGRSDAFTEVRRQNDAWRGKSDEGSRLRLVPPPEVDEEVQGLADAGSGAVDSAPAGTDSAELQGRIAALEGELQESRRLIEIRDRELQA
jgi:pilus assembly protein FimV